MYKSGNKRTLKVSSMTLGWPSTHSQALAWALGIVFASIITWEVVAIMRQEGYAATSVYKIIFVFLCYSCGLVCASALHEKAELRRYGKIIAENNIMLKMAATALNASSTAIAVVDGRRSVMLFNSAFQDVSGNSRDSDLGRKQLERVLKLTSDQTLTLMMCFQHVSPATAVFVLEGRAVRVTISFLLNDFVERSFHVVLTDIANEHAAVSLAQREALETLAIMQAVEELTYRVGQPQNLDVAQYIPRIDIIPDHHDDYLDEPGYYR